MKVKYTVTTFQVKIYHDCGSALYVYVGYQIIKFSPEKVTMNILANEASKINKLGKPDKKNAVVNFNSSDENATKSYVSYDGYDDNIGDNILVAKDNWNIYYQTIKLLLLLQSSAKVVGFVSNSIHTFYATITKNQENMLIPLAYRSGR